MASGPEIIIIATAATFFTAMVTQKKFRRLHPFPSSRPRASFSSTQDSHENTMQLRNEIRIRNHTRHDREPGATRLPELRRGQLGGGEPDHLPTIRCDRDEIG